jgi:hypothetical protein
LAKRLYGVGALIAFVLLLSAAMTWRMGSIATNALAAEEETTLSTAALAEAQSAVWALRWGVANYLATSDAAAKAKMVADSEAARRFRHRPSDVRADPAERRRTHQAHRGARGVRKYVEARLEFFRLMEAGKTDEAARCATADSRRPAAPRTRPLPS